MGGFLARMMGAPIGKILCATNANDIVHRTLRSGDMTMGGARAAAPPSPSPHPHHRRHGSGTRV
eukprot:5760576-Prymnesium_polylepis.1